MKTETDFNPRYVHYAREHSKSPDEMLEHDRAAWPGGLMTGFILWISERWSEWYRLNNWHPDWPKGEAEHREFDEWLASRENSVNPSALSEINI